MGCLLAAITLVGFTAPGHPDLIDQIVRVTEQLHSGETADLFRQRADMFRRHAQFDAALDDIASAERLAPRSTTLFLDHARILSDAGRSGEALEKLQAFMKGEPNCAEALIIQARCEARLGRPEAAIADYTKAIARCSAATPDLFLERAQLQADLGKFDAAVRGLDEAITNSAYASPLQLAAIDYDRKRGAYDDALARVDRILARYPVKEPWLTLRAEVLEQAGRTAEAEKTFQQVLTGISAYPEVRRTLDLTKQLEQRARNGLARTRPVPASNP